MPGVTVDPNAPTYHVDVFGDDFIQDPYPRCAEMRALGPVLWLSRHEVFAAVRYAEVSQALRDPQTFISGKGVAINDQANALLIGNSLNSDNPEHDAMRAVTSAPLLPGALDNLRPQIEAASERLADMLVKNEAFDAVGDLAQYLPITIVAELVGLSNVDADQMLKWASAAFNLFGPLNARSLEALGAAIAL